MNSINNISNNQPSFGMAFRFGKGGAKRMAKAFESVPEEGRKMIESQSANKNIDIWVTENSIEVRHKPFRNIMLEDFFMDRNTEENYHKNKGFVERVLRPKLERKHYKGDDSYFLREPFYLAVDETNLQREFSEDLYKFDKENEPLKYISL